MSLSTVQRALVEPWILPLIQGYVEIRTLVVHSKNPPNVLKTARQPSVASRGSHGNSEAGEDVDTMTEKSVPKCEYKAINSHCPHECIQLYRYIHVHA